MIGGHQHLNFSCFICKFMCYVPELVLLCPSFEERCEHMGVGGTVFGG